MLYKTTVIIMIIIIAVTTMSGRYKLKFDYAYPINRSSEVHFEWHLEGFLLVTI